MSKNHVHKYRRFKTANDKTLWRCTLPHCSHVIYDENILPGREAVCWACGDVFTLPDKIHMITAKPVCDLCTEARKKVKEELTWEEKLEKLRNL